MDLAETIRSQVKKYRAQPPSASKMRVESKKRKGVMSQIAKTQRDVEESMQSTTQDAIESINSLMALTRDSRTLPEDQETPQLDYFLGEDINIREDTLEAIEDRTMFGPATADLYEARVEKPTDAKAIDSSSDSDAASEVQPTDGKALEDRVVNRIIELEGFIGTAKKAFTNEKYFTYGYGTYGPNVKEGQTITEEEAERLLREEELPKRMKLARSLFKDFDSFSEDLKVELLQGIYRGDFEAGQKVVNLINKGMWDTASKEFLNHEEYKKAKGLGSKSDRPGIVPRLESISKALYQEQFN